MVLYQSGGAHLFCAFSTGKVSMAVVMTPTVGMSAGDSRAEPDTISREGGSAEKKPSRAVLLLGIDAHAHADADADADPEADAGGCVGRGAGTGTGTADAAAAGVGPADAGWCRGGREAGCAGRWGAICGVDVSVRATGAGGPPSVRWAGAVGAGDRCACGGGGRAAVGSAATGGGGPPGGPMTPFLLGLSGSAAITSSTV